MICESPQIQLINLFEKLRQKILLPTTACLTGIFLLPQGLCMALLNPWNTLPHFLSLPFLILLPWYLKISDHWSLLLRSLPWPHRLDQSSPKICHYIFLHSSFTAIITVLIHICFQIHHLKNKQISHPLYYKIHKTRSNSILAHRIIITPGPAPGP